MLVKRADLATLANALILRWEIMQQMTRLNSLWVGRDLTYVERLCLTSAVSVGHEFVLWSYDPDALTDVPAGIEVRDAAEVMARDQLVSYRDTGSVALGANLWRIQLLAKGFGCWVDMDFIFIKPIDLSEPYIFGWEHEGWINNAIILAPPDSQLIHDLVETPKPNKCPPWFGPRRSMMYYWRRMREGHIGIEDMPWGTYSSGMLTHCVKRNGLESFAKSPEELYPVRWKDAAMLYGPAEAVRALITDATRGIHMWHSRLGDLVRNPPPPGSYIEEVCRQFGVETGAGTASPH